MKKTIKLNLIKDFSKLFDFKFDAQDDDDKIPENERKGYMDTTNVMMVIPKLKSVRELILQNFDVDKNTKIPDLAYKVHMVSGGEDKIKVYARMMGEKIEYKENVAMFSPEYLKVIATLCSKTKSDKVTIKFRNDYPMWMETDEMICIIAPRVSND